MRLSADLAGKIVDSIRAVTNPSAIIVFGSYARGEAREDSDLDLLVIRRSEFRAGESRRRELGDLYRSVSLKVAMPKDIFLLTKHEFEEWRETTNHLAAAAWQEGQVLYGQV